MRFQGDLWSWLQNEKCYDQFAVHYERDAQGSKYGSTSPFVGVYEYRKGQDPVPVTERHVCFLINCFIKKRDT